MDLHCTSFLAILTFTLTASIGQTNSLSIQDFLQPRNLNLGVVVAGGSRGIGLGFVRFFLEQGADVMILSQGSAEERAKELQILYPNQKVLGFQADLANIESLGKALRKPEIQKFFAKSQVLINSAGTAVLDPTSKPGTSERKKEDEAWRRMMAIKSQGSRILSDSFIAAHQKSALILQVSSVAAIYRFPFPGKGYSESNWRLIQLADQIHQEHSERIISWAIAPGIVATDMTQNHFPIPAPVLERWGDSVENVIASVISTLLNPEKAPERFVAPEHRVLIPGKKINYQMIEAFDHGKRYLKEENTQDYLETLMQIQLNTSNWRPSQLSERLDFVENWVHWINRTNRSLGFLPPSLSEAPITKKQQALQAGLGLCSRFLYRAVGKKVLKGFSD